MGSVFSTEGNEPAKYSHVNHSGPFSGKSWSEVKDAFEEKFPTLGLWFLLALFGPDYYCYERRLLETPKQDTKNIGKKLVVMTEVTMRQKLNRVWASLHRLDGLERMEKDPDNFKLDRHEKSELEVLRDRYARLPHNVPEDVWLPVPSVADRGEDWGSDAQRIRELVAPSRRTPTGLEDMTDYPLKVVAV